MYIYQNKDWPRFIWDNKSLLSSLGGLRNLQGKLLGKMEGLGFSLQKEALLETLTQDVVKTTEIEGENLDVAQVRSSIARRLGLEISGLIPSDHNVDGVVEMMLDATQQYNNELSSERLFGWHATLFPTGRSGMNKISVGKWRKDEKGPMQVVSGAIGKERVHFVAPPAEMIEQEMGNYITWFNNELDLEPVIKSGVAHLWFVSIHPFDDGNGRIARAIADMQLARADNTNQRFYSMSSQILSQKKGYYEILEKTQRGTLDITEWLHWYLECMTGAILATEKTLEKVLSKARFWDKHKATQLNERQHQMLNKLLDDFFGNLTSTKWAKIMKCSQDTALRDIQDLITKGILNKAPEGGRSTSYLIVFPKNWSNRQY